MSRRALRDRVGDALTAGSDSEHTPGNPRAASPAHDGFEARLGYEQVTISPEPAMAYPARFTRRDSFGLLASSALALPGRTAAVESAKPLRGAFTILATPYTATKAVDYGDLEVEVEFLDRCGVQGMVWPQNASDLSYLSKDERIRGMEVIAKAARGRKPALFLGVQAEDTPSMLEFARLAEDLEPDAVIAIPPTKAASLDDYREYYAELCTVAKRPVFIQTAGGSPRVEPTVEFIVEMGSSFDNFGYLKEEYGSVATAIERMKAMAKHRPGAVKIILGAFRAGGWTYEMRLEMDGTLTGGPMYGDIYAHLWELHLADKRDEVREVYSKLLLMTNLEQAIPGLRSYMMKRRGIFKTTASRRGDYQYSREAVAEIEHNFAALKPYLRV